MADWMSLNYVVVDVEGNGQQPPDLVELAAVPIVGGVIREPKSWLVHPDEPIKHFATRIHGLTNKDVADAPLFAAIKDEVLSTLTGAALVAHNAHVDVDVLTRKLGNLVEAFKLAEGLPEDLSPHRATYDALVAARLFVQLARRYRSKNFEVNHQEGATMKLRSFSDHQRGVFDANARVLSLRDTDA